MKAVVLGSAAGGGYPQWNCRCAVCALAWDGDPRVRRRTQSSIAVTGDGVRWTLFNASPEITAQIAATPDLWPRERRHSPIGAVVLTNGDIDHVAGLLSLRERQAIDVVAFQPVLDALNDSPVFNALSAATRRQASPGEWFDLPGDLSAMMFPVPGKVPLYLEGDTPEIGVEGGETAGVLIRSAGRTLAYVPGCALITDAVRDRLQDADAVLFDGTVYTDDEMIQAGVGEKTGRRMGHVPIAGEGGSLPLLSALPAGRKIYVHINNTNPVLIEGSPERQAIEAAGVEIAHDGMEIAL